MENVLVFITPGALACSLQILRLEMKQVLAFMHPAHFYHRKEKKRWQH